jgi:hypothetical protein
MWCGELSQKWGQTGEDYVGFEVFTAMVIKSINFWDMTPCRPLSFNRRFGGTYCLHLHLLNLFLRPWRLFLKSVKELRFCTYLKNYSNNKSKYTFWWAQKSVKCHAFNLCTKLMWVMIFTFVLGKTPTFRGFWMECWITDSFQPHCCPGVDSVLTEMSTRNLPGVKGRPARGADNLASTSHNTMGLHGLLQGQLYLLPEWLIRSSRRRGNVPVRNRNSLSCQRNSLLLRSLSYMGEYTEQRV